MGSFISDGLDFLGLGDKEIPGYQSPYAADIQNWISQLNPGITDDINFYNSVGGDRRGAQQNAFRALDPVNNISIARGMAQRLRAGATSQGMGQARQFAQQGYGKSVQQGAQLGAMNQANNQAGQMQMSLMDPQRFAQQYQMQAGMYSPQALLQGMNFGMGLMNMGDQQAMMEFNTRRTQPGLLSSLAPMAGQVMPLFGGGGGGGQPGPGYGPMP